MGKKATKPFYREKKSYHLHLHLEFRRTPKWIVTAFNKPPMLVGRQLSMEAESKYLPADITTHLQLNVPGLESINGQK
jgi:hypothetical protein